MAALDHAAAGACDMDACEGVDVGLCIMDAAIAEAIEETRGAMYAGISGLAAGPWFAGVCSLL